MSQCLHIHDFETEAASARRGAVDIVWVPGEEIACHLLEVPPVSRRKWLAMAPWLLEERVLDRADDLEIACGERDRSGRVPVLAVKKQVLGSWKKVLADNGVTAGNLVPDYFALPWREGEVSVAFRGDRCLLRWGAWQGAAGSRALILPLVDKLLVAGGDRLRLWGDVTGDVPPPLDVSPRGEPRPLFTGVQPPWLAVFRSDARRRGSRWPLPARVAAGLAGLALVLGAAGTVVETRQAIEQADYFEGELRRSYRHHFGDDYGFDMGSFQRVVSSRIEGSEPGGPRRALERLGIFIKECGSCRIDTLTVTGERVSALLSGRGVGERLANRRDDMAVEQQGENWLVTLGGER